MYTNLMTFFNSKSYLFLIYSLFFIPEASLTPEQKLKQEQTQQQEHNALKYKLNKGDQKAVQIASKKVQDATLKKAELNEKMHQNEWRQKWLSRAKWGLGIAWLGLLYLDSFQDLKIEYSKNDVTHPIDIINYRANTPNLLANPLNLLSIPFGVTWYFENSYQSEAQTLKKEKKDCIRISQEWLNALQNFNQNI